MDIALQNHFPAALQKSAVEIFQCRLIQPVLLRLLPAPFLNQDHGSSRSQVHTLLHPREAALYESYRFPKRRREYLTGRVCAKLAVRNYLKGFSNPHRPTRLPGLQQIEIVPDATGRPGAVLHEPKLLPTEMDISISHSGDYALALAASLPCGIDVQFRQESLVRVREKYCDSEEVQLMMKTLPQCNTLVQLSLLWAAKEAAKKALSALEMVGFHDLRLRKVAEHRGSDTTFSLQMLVKRIGMVEAVTAVAGLIGEYSLAICLREEVKGDAGTAGS